MAINARSLSNSGVNIRLAVLIVQDYLPRIATLIVEHGVKNVDLGVQTLAVFAMLRAVRRRTARSAFRSVTDAVVRGIITEAPGDENAAVGK